MEAYGGIEVQLRVFLNSPPNEDEMLALRVGHPLDGKLRGRY
jgi:hypothetical protein